MGGSGGVADPRVCAWRAVVGRFEVAEQREYRFLRELLHFLYSEFPETRRLVRALIGRFLIGFTKVWDKHMAVAPMLEVREKQGEGGEGRRAPGAEVRWLVGAMPHHDRAGCRCWARSSRASGCL